MFPAAYFALQFFTNPYWPSGDSVVLLDGDLDFTAEGGQLHFIAEAGLLDFTAEGGQLHFIAEEPDGAIMSNQIPDLEATGKRSAAFDFSSKMASGEALTVGTVAVSSSPAGITHDSATVNGSAIEVNKRTVPASQALLCRLVTAGATPGVYTVTVTINSDLQEGLKVIASVNVV